MILPPGRAAAVAHQSAHGKADHGRIAAFDARVSAGQVDHPERLVKPDRDRRAQAPDEARGEPRLRLGEGIAAGVVDPSTVAARPPAVGEVAVEVHASRIAPRPHGQPVRVQVLDRPQRDTGNRAQRLQVLNDRDTGAFVAMDAANDEDATRSAMPDPHDLDPTALKRTATSRGGTTRVGASRYRCKPNVGGRVDWHAARRRNYAPSRQGQRGSAGPDA